MASADRRHSASSTTTQNVGLRPANGRFQIGLFSQSLCSGICYEIEGWFNALVLFQIATTWQCEVDNIHLIHGFLSSGL